PNNLCHRLPFCSKSSSKDRVAVPRDDAELPGRELLPVELSQNRRVALRCRGLNVFPVEPIEPLNHERLPDDHLGLLAPRPAVGADVVLTIALRRRAPRVPTLPHRSAPFPRFRRILTLARPVGRSPPNADHASRCDGIACRSPGIETRGNSGPA